MLPIQFNDDFIAALTRIYHRKNNKNNSSDLEVTQMIKQRERDDYNNLNSTFFKKSYNSFQDLHLNFS